MLREMLAEIPANFKLGVLGASTGKRKFWGWVTVAFLAFAVLFTAFALVLNAAVGSYIAATFMGALLVLNVVNFISVLESMASIEESHRVMERLNGLR